MLLASINHEAIAATFILPENGDNVIGNIKVISIQNPKTTLLDVARHYDLSYEEIAQANPDVSIWVPEIGSIVHIPTQFILPPGPRKGVIINISQRRLFYFPKAKPHQPAQVVTYPISIAREGWHTPLGKTKIVAKHKDPSWFVPKSIKEEHLDNGELNFPDYFPPGPDNPMGMLAMQTGFTGIYIHGTNMPWGVGLRTSHGCLHLYPEDAAEIFPAIPVGTPVHIIDEPILVGKLVNNLYLSSYKPAENSQIEASAAAKAATAVFKYTQENNDDIQYIDWDRMRNAANLQQNVAISITLWSPGLEDIIESRQPEPYVFQPYGIDANAAAPPTTPRQ